MTTIVVAGGRGRIEHFDKVEVYNALTGTWNNAGNIKLDSVKLQIMMYLSFSISEPAIYNVWWCSGPL